MFIILFINIILKGIFSIYEKAKAKFEIITLRTKTFFLKH
jgi:hypothetical protein